MSRIASSGPNGSNPLAPGGGTEPRQGTGRDTRFDDRPKGMGGRESGLRARTGGSDEQNAALAGDGRAEAFGRRLEGALGRQGRVGERGSQNETASRDSGTREHASETEGDVSPALASLFAASLPGGTPAAAGGTSPATSSPSAPSGVGEAPARRGALTSLWTQDVETVVYDTANARPAAASEATGTTIGEAEDGSAAQRPETPRARRLLAESGAPDPATVQPQPDGALLARAPQGADPSPAPDGSAAPASTTAERVNGITDRVERAIQAEDRLGAGQPVTLSIPLGKGEDGLARLDVAVTPDGLDVTLVRGAGGEASADLVRAAQSLVERLQRRFPKGHVRVLDAAEGGEATRAAETKVVRPADGARRAS